MEFLKEILGEDLYAQVLSKIGAHNETHASEAEKQIKLANLAAGGYVAKGKFDELQTKLSGKEQEITSANELIANLKKSAKDDGDLQQKITDYETKNAELQAQLTKTLIESGLRVALMEAGAKDLDYLIWKSTSDGKTLELGEDGKIKGLETLISTLKTSAPAHFADAGDPYEPNPLRKGDPGAAGPQSLEEALTQHYNNSGA